MNGSLIREKGVTSVIVIVLIMSVVMTVLLVGLKNSNTVVYELTDTADNLKALFLAESAIERAAYRYKSIACASLVETALPLADGSIEVNSATVNGSSCDIEVKGMVNDSVRVLSTTLTKNAGSTSAYDAWAVGKNGTISGRIGGVWSLVTSNVPQELRGVACTDADYCIAVGKKGWVSVWDGTSWSSTQIQKKEDFRAVSCSPSDVNFCVIVGEGDSTDGVTRIWDRSSGSPGSSKVDVEEELLGIACTGSSCAAVGKRLNGHAYTIRGNATTWTKESSDLDVDLAAVSCLDTSASNCWGGGKDDNDKFTLAQRPGPGGSVTWETISSDFGASHDDVEDLNGISCVISLQQCWAVGKKGQTLRYQSGAWSYYGSIHNRDLRGISCRENDGSCIAVGKNGAIVSWNGTTWITEASATNKEFKAVSYIPSSSSGGAGSVTVTAWQEVTTGS